MENKTKKTKEDYDVSILDLFDESMRDETASGDWKMECPDCGLQGGRTRGFKLFPDDNRAYCHSSGKNFTLLEAYALKKGFIKCLDGRESGEKKKVLGGELYTLSLDEFKLEYGTDIYNKLIAQLNIRSSIEIPGNNRLISDFCDDIGDVYKSRNVLFFRSESRSIIEIGRIKKINKDGIKYIENGFVPVSGARLITLAEMFIKPWTTIFMKNGNTMHVDKSMNKSMTVTALESPNFQNKLPVISRIFDFQIPIIYKDKLTFPKKGYDIRFGSWLPYNAPEIVEDMYNLRDAKVLIEKIFEEFCFLTEKDRIHAIAGFITPFLRGLFPKFSTRAPVFGYMANRERAGKDYCAGITGILYEGVATEEPPISTGEQHHNSNDEIRKKIMGCMIQGKKRFHSSNNKGLLNNSVLESVTTAETYSDRILGKSEIITFPNEIDYSFSGNIGMKLTPDLANRSRVINLHLVCEDANSREFKNPNLHGWILENRGSIISALFTLVKNWFENGCPKGSIPFTSFPVWADICGGIMEAAGYDNPCKLDKSAMISLDSESEEMKQLYEICYAKRPGEWLSKKEIKDLIEDEDIMNYFDFDSKADQTKFALKIDKFTDRELSKILMMSDHAKRANRRKYKFVDFNQEMSQLSQNESKTEIDDGNVGNVQPGVEKHTKDQVYKEGDNKVDEKGQKVVTLVTFGNVSPTPNESLKKITADKDKVTKRYQRYHKPSLYKLSQNLSKINPQLVAKNELNVTNPEGRNPTKPYQPINSIDDLTQRYKDRIKEMNTPKKDDKPKTDREVQFWDPACEETKSIVAKCSKQEVIDWITNNPGVSFEKLDEALDLGWGRWIVELTAEDLIDEVNDGWKMKNGNNN